MFSQAQIHYFVPTDMHKGKIYIRKLPEFCIYTFTSVLDRGHCGHDCLVVGFISTYAISAYHHYCCEFEPCSWPGVLDTTLIM